MFNDINEVAATAPEVVKAVGALYALLHSGFGQFKHIIFEQLQDLSTGIDSCETEND